jgi:flagellar hook-associated protein 1 FlgK
MSLFGLFDIGRSALMASQTGIAVTSNNIANVNTPGYSRQEVILEIANPVASGRGFIGRGVTVSGIRRNYDGFLQMQLLGQEQNRGRSYALNRSLGEIEGILNDQNGLGLSESLQDFFNAWQDVATNPEGIPQRDALIYRARSLINAAKQIEERITSTIKNINKSIDDVVNKVNELSGRIAQLNERIAGIESGLSSEKALDLRDQRDKLLRELSELVDFSYYEDRNGSVSITVGMRNLVSGTSVNAMSSVTLNDGAKKIMLDGIDITERIQRGELGGLIAAKDEIGTKTLYSMRRLIASITKEVNLIHRSGYGLDGSTGNDFFNPLTLSTTDGSSGADITSATITDYSSLTLDEYEITFDGSGNYYVRDNQTGTVVSTGAYVSGNPISFDGIEVTITGAVTPDDRFSVSPLTNAIKNLGLAISDPEKIAASSSSSGIPGDGSNAVNMVNLGSSQVGNLGDTFMDYYRGIVTVTGTLSRAASDSLTFDENLLSEIQSRRDSVSGVSLDEEAINLIRYQRSFEAAAKMISVTDELLDIVMKL